jgi:hypothetical protein
MARTVIGMSPWAVMKMMGMWNVNVGFPQFALKIKSAYAR